MLIRIKSLLWLGYQVIKAQPYMFKLQGNKINLVSVDVYRKMKTRKMKTRNLIKRDLLLAAKYSCIILCLKV